MAIFHFFFSLVLPVSCTSYYLPVYLAQSLVSNTTEEVSSNSFSTQRSRRIVTFWSLLSLGQGQYSQKKKKKVSRERIKVKKKKRVEEKSFQLSIGVQFSRFQVSDTWFLVSIFLHLILIVATNRETRHRHFYSFHKTTSN